MKQIGLLLTLLLLLAGCQAGRAPQPPAPPAEAAPVTAPEPAEVSAADSEAEPAAAQLFATADVQLFARLKDPTGIGGAGETTELFFRRGDLAVTVRDDKPYATWLINQDGVWRADPKGGALLRYLPARLKPGTAWKQRSGDAEVWFLLESGFEHCSRSGAIHLFQVAPSACWDLTVLNRGEREIITFARGPARVETENWADPDRSAVWEVWRLAPADQPADRMEALAREAAAALPAPAPVTDVTPAEFAQAAAAMFRASLPADRTTVGQQAIVYGYLSRWTVAPFHFFAATGARLGMFKPYPPGSAHRLQEVQAAGLPGPLWLYEQAEDPVRPHPITLLQIARSGQVVMTHGWEPKAYATTGNRAGVNEAGHIVVEWELDDPARHTRLREYELQRQDSDGSYVAAAIATRYLPTGGQLRQPATPAEVLQAAWCARWFGLADELPRYFATAEAAAVLARNQIEPPPYGPGTVRLGAITPPAGPNQAPSVAVVSDSPGPDGTAGFLAEWSFFESSTHVWGKVTFGQDATGQTVITRITIEGQVTTSV